MTVLGGGMFGGGADGRKVDPWPVESTVTRCNESLTRGKKMLKAKANKKKKMGAKCNTRREPGQAQPVSSKWGIRNYFSSTTRPMTMFSRYLLKVATITFFSSVCNFCTSSTFK